MTPFQYICVRNLKSVMLYLYSNGGDPRLKDPIGESSAFLKSLISFPKNTMKIRIKDITFQFQ